MTISKLRKLYEKEKKLRRWTDDEKGYVAWLERRAALADQLAAALKSVRYDIFHKEATQLAEITRQTEKEVCMAFSDWSKLLQEKVTAKLENPPDTETIDATF